DEALLGVDAFRPGCRGRYVCGRGARRDFDARFESPHVRAIVRGVLEIRRGSAPLDCRRMLRHGLYILNTPKLVSSSGALSEAEIASARMRRVSSGAMIPSSQSRAEA